MPAPKRHIGLNTSLEEDPNHHLTGPFLPQTPLGSATPERSASPVTLRARSTRKHSPYLRWATQPSSALKLLLIPIFLYFFWDTLTPYLPSKLRTPNPFGPFFLLSGHISTSSQDDPRYAKTWWDLAFVSYYIVFWSFIRQSLSSRVFGPLARYFGLKREAKIDRFCEQGYAVVYFAIFGAWGYHVMTQLPTFWYNTKAFWIDYPHWDMKPELKRYYLMQSAYWCQQLLVLVLGLEKPRKDYRELVAHHFVTLWLVGWSYLINLTLIGSAVYMSMDIPDAFLAFSKILNYIQWNRMKIVAFVTFMVIWTYFRHYLNLIILGSVWTEYDLIPETSRRWSWADGTYLVPWMKYQVFAPLVLLQLLNLFWYYLIWRVLWRAWRTSVADDDRSEDEGEEDDNPHAQANGKKED